MLGCGNIGAVELHEQCKVLEELAADGDLTDVEQLVEQASQQLALVQDAVRAL